jgi:hypothetical protein
LLVSPAPNSHNIFYVIYLIFPQLTKSLASTSTKWNNLAWAKISHLDIPDRLKNPLVIFKKCSPKSIFSLALDLTDEVVEDGSDYVQLLTEFKYLTNLQVSAPRLGTSELYDAIYQLTQLKCLDLVDNNVDDGNRFARMTALKKITELGITAEGHDFGEKIHQVIICI